MSIDKLALIKQLEEEVNLLEKGIICNEPKEFTDLKVEHDKLVYRKNFLERELHKAQSRLQCKNESLSTQLNSLFSDAVSLSLQLESNAVVRISDKADFQFDAAMQLFSQLKSTGNTQFKSPRDVAQAILKALPANDLIDKVEVAGPGFINIFLSKDQVLARIETLVTEGVKPWYEEKKTIIVDLSSPNIAKAMHVGHLRSTIIGDCIARLFEWLGHNVLRINHVGDWGTQFGMLIAYLQDEFPDHHKVSPPIHDLEAFYKASKKRFTENSEFKRRAYQLVVDLQAHKPDVYASWQRICEVSRIEFQKIYDRLQVEQTERGESFYQSRMIDVVKDLDSRGFLIEDEGRKIMFDGESQVPLTVVKSDGGYTYDTSDLATIRQRIDEEKADRVIYVVDQGQSVHFTSIFGCARRCGYYNKNKVRVEHVGFGMVLGPDGKRFRTREGDTVHLIDLLDEGVERARASLTDKDYLTPEEKEAAVKAVAYGCIKYADLSHNRLNDYRFSFERMLDSKGNTAVYLLYCLTRIRSIARLAGVTLEELQASKEPVSLNEPSEFKLAKCLLTFHDVLRRITDDLMIHHLCEYLYHLAGVFTEFYDKIYCIEKDKSTGKIVKIHMGRLKLCEATAKTLETGLHLLGIETLHRM